LRLHLSENLEVPSAPIYCKERMRLLDEFVAAVSGYLRVESARLAAAAGNGESQFAGELEVARQRKDASKEAIKEHEKEHRC
jgi:hypothetical protein